MWQKHSDRQYKATFGTLTARLLCPNTPGIPEQHNKWLLLWGEQDNNVVLGEYGMPIPVLLSAATEEIKKGLLGCLTALQS